MNKFLQTLHDRLPPWMANWFDGLVPVVEALLIALGAWLAMRVAHPLIRKLTDTCSLPGKVTALLLRVVAFVVYAGAVLWALEREWGCPGPCCGRPSPDWRR